MRKVNGISALAVGLIAIVFGSGARDAAQTDSIPVGPGWSALRPPYVIAHRGSANLYPENTMEAYRAALLDGNPFVEADCYLLADGAVGIMHDATLDRTTTSSGPTALQTAKSWRQLKINGRRLAGEKYGMLKAPLLEDILDEFGNKHIVDLEAKNSGSGVAIVRLLTEHQIRPDYVLINSFLIDELSAAIAAGYPCCYDEKNLVKYAIPPVRLAEKGIKWVAIHTEVTPDYIAKAKQAGVKVIVYTVNRRYDWERFRQMGAEGCYTDDPTYLLRMSRERAGDGFLGGELGSSGRGFGNDSSSKNPLLLPKHGEYFQSLLAGETPAVLAASNGPILVYEFSVQINQVSGGLSWIEAILAQDDRRIESGHFPGKLTGDGLEFVLRYTGEIEIINCHDGSGATLAKAKIAQDFRDLAGDYTIVFSGGTVGFGKKNGGGRIAAAVAADGMRYLSFGAKGVDVQFQSVLYSTIK